MLRMGSVMKLRPGMAAEYEKRHAALWPELIDAIKKGGASNYTIFHDPETDLLFEYIEIEDAAVWAARSGDASRDESYSSRRTRSARMARSTSASTSTSSPVARLPPRR